MNYRDDCRHVILNATVCIADCLKAAHLALGVSRPDRATPALKEIDHYLYRIEGAVRNCQLVREGENAEIRPDIRIARDNL